MRGEGGGGGVCEDEEDAGATLWLVESWIEGGGGGGGRGRDEVRRKTWTDRGEEETEDGSVTCSSNARPIVPYLRLIGASEAADPPTSPHPAVSPPVPRIEE